MSNPIRRTRVCGTHPELAQGNETTKGSDKAQADLRTLSAVDAAAIAAAAAPRLFETSKPKRGAARRPRLDTVQDCLAAFASGVPLSGKEIARVYRIWRAEMMARGLPLDWYSRTRRDDESLQ